MDAAKVRALVGEIAAALRERGFWTDGAGPAAAQARSGEAQASPAAFCAWIELILLPHIAAALAQTQRPEPVDGFSAAALSVLGHEPAHAEILRLTHELELALQRATAESALDAALDQAESSEEAADAFYSLFANTRLLVPLATDDAGAPLQDDGAEFSPLTVTVEDTEYLPVFDSQTRLEDWGGGPLPHTHLSGMALAATVAEAVTLHVVLNPGSGHEKVFVPGELAALRAQITQAAEDLLLCRPGNITEAVRAELCTGLSAVPEIQSAHFALRLAESESGAGDLLLAVQSTAPLSEALRERVRALGAAALPGHALTFLFSGHDAGAEAVVASMPAFYTVV